MGNLVHEGWCNVNMSDDARGSMSVDRTTCDCGALRRHESAWKPNRDGATEVGAGWRRFLERLKLDSFTRKDSTSFFLRGQDGWAFAAAVRFQDFAHDFADSDEAYYWGGYYLLGMIIEKTRTDLVLLEAIEALALAYMYGNLASGDAAEQLRQMGVWP